MIIRGTPHGLVFDEGLYSSGYGYVQLRHSLWVRDANDQLLRLSRYLFDGPRVWQETNVSQLVGGQLIRSDVHAIGGTGPRGPVAARGPHDELLEFWNSGDHWWLVNLSTAVAGGRLITGRPNGYSLGDTKHIVARGQNDELLEWWSSQRGWEEVVNVSAAVGGQLIRSDPRGYPFGGTQHIVARGANDELLEWYWTRQDGWGVLDVSAAVDGQLIRGAPYGYTWLFSPDRNHVIRSQHIVAQGLNGELLEWYWLPEPSWRKQRVLPTEGEGEGEWIEGILNVMMS